MDVKVVGFLVNFSMDGVFIVSCNIGNCMIYIFFFFIVDWFKGDKFVEEIYEGLFVWFFNKNVMDKVWEVGEILYEV